MRNKMQIEDIKNNIEIIYNRLKNEDTDNEIVQILMNDIERLTVKLMEACVV